MPMPSNVPLGRKCPALTKPKKRTNWMTRVNKPHLRWTVGFRSKPGKLSQQAQAHRPKGKKEEPYLGQLMSADPSSSCITHGDWLRTNQLKRSWKSGSLDLLPLFSSGKCQQWNPWLIEFNDCSCPILVGKNFIFYHLLSSFLVSPMFYGT